MVGSVREGVGGIREAVKIVTVATESGLFVSYTTSPYSNRRSLIMSLCGKQKKKSELMRLSYQEDHYR